MQPVGEYVLDDRTNFWNVWHIAADGGDAPWTARPRRGGSGMDVRRPRLRGHSRGVPVFAIGGDVHVGTAGHSHRRGVVRAVGAARRRSHGHRHRRVRRRAPRHRAVLARRPVAGHHGRGRPSTRHRHGRREPARTISFPTTGERIAHGLYYAPANSQYDAPAGTAPPLVVMIHGGPTAGAEPRFSLATQFWTTRGFAVVDVDYGGSSGYGRAFRDELDGQWGIVDVDDCCAAASHLAEQGLADPAGLFIRGGSAGGFTVLGALALRDVFVAGASYFGVADLSALAADTHKFESRYLDRLVGPWPAARAVYDERSPIHHTDGFDRPLIVFQGLDDMVVPPNQSEMIVAALRAKGVECEYHALRGRGTRLPQGREHPRFARRRAGLLPADAAAALNRR